MQFENYSFIHILQNFRLRKKFGDFTSAAHYSQNAEYNAAETNIIYSAPVSRGLSDNSSQIVLQTNLSCTELQNCNQI